jgi:hypothetical protein
MIDSSCEPPIGLTRSLHKERGLRPTKPLQPLAGLEWFLFSRSLFRSTLEYPASDKTRMDYVFEFSNPLRAGFLIKLVS